MTTRYKIWSFASRVNSILWYFLLLVPLLLHFHDRRALYTNTMYSSLHTFLHFQIKFSNVFSNLSTTDDLSIPNLKMDTTEDSNLNVM